MRGFVFSLALLQAGMASAAGLAVQVQDAWLSPRAAAFASASADLVPAIEMLCKAGPGQGEAALMQARQRWTQSLSAWERLAGVAIGPVLERRSQRQIDFTPTRARLIEKGIKAAPKTLADLELVGTPGKGLPALEWLLWAKPAQPGSAACAYAKLLAEEVGQEAKALEQSHIKTQDEQALLTELVNQWVGGIERLRWPGMEMPLRVAMTANPPTTPDYPRRDSGASAIVWAAQWDAVRGIGLVIDTTLRERGKVETAAALKTELDALDAAMRGLDGNDPERILAAAKQLAGLKHLAENSIAAALGVSIGFSDSDGD